METVEGEDNGDLPDHFTEFGVDNRGKFFIDSWENAHTLMFEGHDHEPPGNIPTGMHDKIPREHPRTEIRELFTISWFEFGDRKTLLMLYKPKVCTL